MGETLISIQGCSTNECPVSLITPFSKTVAFRHSRAMTLSKINLSLFGEGSELSAKLVDALEVLTDEHESTEHQLAAAREAIISKSMKGRR
jgi:hypothetical protein